MEFPVDGLFTFGDFPLGGRFRVSGDTAIPDTTIPAGPAQKKNRPSFQVPLGFQSSWSEHGWTIYIEGAQVLRTLLLFDNAGMSDATISNLFIKIPDISVSLDSILSEAGTKIGCDPNELILLDVKFFPISDEKGILIMCTVIRGCIHNYNI